MKTIVLKSFRPIASLCVAALAILSTASASKAMTLSYSFYKEAGPNPAYKDAYSCFAPPATDPTAEGPAYNCQPPPNSLPGKVFVGPPPGGIPTAGQILNVYNDTPYAIASQEYIPDIDPNLTLDFANFKSDVFSKITQNSNGSVLFSGGAVAPYSWYQLVKVFTNVTSPTTAFHVNITFAAVPEPSAALSLLVFGTFGAGLLVKRQVGRKRLKLSPAVKSQLKALVRSKHFSALGS